MFFVPAAHKMALHSLDGARHGIACIRDHRLEFLIRERAEHPRLLREVLVDALRGKRGFVILRVFR